MSTLMRLREERSGYVVHEAGRPRAAEIGRAEQLAEGRFLEACRREVPRLRVEIVWQELSESFRGVVWFDAPTDTYRVVVHPHGEIDANLRVALHELAHVKAGHVPRPNEPPSWTTREGLVDVARLTAAVRRREEVMPDEHHRMEREAWGEAQRLGGYHR